MTMLARVAPLPPDKPALCFLDRVMASVGLPPVRAERSRADAADFALRWARSGLMALTGPSDAPPAAPSSDVLSGCAEIFGAVTTLAALHGTRLDLDLRLLTERAALLGLGRRGRSSCSGATRLLRTTDGWIAVSLPREEDRDLVAAWIGGTPSYAPWSALARAAAGRTAAEMAEAGQLLGLAVAAATLDGLPIDEQWADRDTAARGIPRIQRLVGRAARTAQRPPRANPIVVDLSALWAGPLCGHILHRVGARVIKVESSRRPDGARLGCAPFYDLLNAGKEAITFDFSSPADLQALRSLMSCADVVIESSRPRALDQLGLGPEQMAGDNPGQTWVSITAYGRTGPWRQRVGFGDDAAASGGLLASQGGGDPCFLGDALADPLTGLAAAAGALAAMAAGGGFLVDAALREVAQFVATSGQRVSPEVLAGVRAAQPRKRPATSPARALGADSVRIRREFGL